MLTGGLLSHISPAVDLLHADGPQPRRSSRSRDRPRIQDGPRQVRGYGSGVDPQVRNLELGAARDCLAGVARLGVHAALMEDAGIFMDICWW